MISTKQKLILAIDIQEEYKTPGRPFYIDDIQIPLANIKKIMDEARRNNIPIWHVQHKQDGQVFGKDSKFSNIIKGFEPISDEPLFIKDEYSCFSAKDLLAEVEKEQPEEIIIIGYGSSMCCLCTIIDGIHRGFKFTLVEDATDSRKIDEQRTGEVMHKSAINILSQYAKIEKTLELVPTLVPTTKSLQYKM